MRFSKTVADYGNAVDVMRRNTIAEFPAALISVLRARVLHNFGPKYHSLFRLASHPVSEWMNFIQDAESNPIIRRINASKSKLVRDKLAFTGHCIKNKLSTIPIICVVTSCDEMDWPGVPIANTPEQWIQAMECASDRLFVKLIDGAHGTDAFVAERSGAERSGALWKFMGIYGSISDLYDFCIERLGARRGWLVQPAIIPHPALSGIMPGNALGTIRAITYVTAEGVKVLFPLLRIPVGDNVTDNFSEGSTGNIVAAIDIDSGVLGVGWMSRSKHWPDMISVDVHPDTGSPISGLKLPHWKEACELMVSAQSLTPQLRTLGWDIALTESGPIIVEANGAYDANLLQVAYGRGLRRELSPILEMDSDRLEHVGDLRTA